MAYPWFRAYSEMLHDPKLLRMTPEQRWVWVGLLCLASDSDERGVLELAPGVPYDLDDLEAALHVDAQTVDCCLNIAAKLGMIQRDGSKLIIANWDKRQYDNPSDTPKQTRERQRKHRSSREEAPRHDQAPGRVTTAVTTMSRDVTTQIRLDTDTDETRLDTDTDRDEISKERAAGAAPDSVSIPLSDSVSVSEDAPEPDERESPELEDAIRRWSGALRDRAAVESNLTQAFAIWGGYPQIRAPDMVRLVNDTGRMVQGMRNVQRPMAYFFRSIRGHLERKLGPPRDVGAVGRIAEPERVRIPGVRAIAEVVASG